MRSAHFSLWLLGLAACLLSAERTSWGQLPYAPPVAAEVGPRERTQDAGRPGMSPAALIPSPYQPTDVLAMVGDQPILAGDLLPTVRQMLEPYAGKAPIDQLEKQQLTLLQQLLEQRIEIKLLYVDFLRGIPEDKRSEAIANIRQQVDEQFYTGQVEEAMKKTGAQSLAELDAKLRSYGTSLELQKIEFREQAIARSLIGRKVNRDPEITHRELLDYYQQEQSEYEFPARARWEKLTVRFDRFPNEAEAELALVNMGNEVLRGAQFAAVARRHSQGPDALDGGYHDWTTKGSLVSTVLDEAIFNLPLGRCSRILRDDQGLHIIRVLERQDAGRVPFVEAQEEIRTALREEKVKQQIREYVDGVRETIHVWTVFDDQP